jgi:hypothetical protein
MRPKSRHRSLPALPADSVRTPPTEPGGDLAGWREQRLRRAGVEADFAASIAADCAMDLHAMIELLERECPPGLAARILAPFDHERNPC